MSPISGSGACAPASEGHVRPWIGCCGFGMARGRYFERFACVEVQQTFYEPPQPPTLSRWREEAPPEFVFAMKAWQLITHESSIPTWHRLRHPPKRPQACGGFRPTAEVTQAWQTTLAAARALDAAVIVFQCPASFTPSREHVTRMERFFTEIAHERKGKLFAWEPRGDWPEDLVARLCERLDLLHAADPFAAVAVPRPTRYYRLHGGRGYAHRYTDGELRQLLGWCDRPTFCFFNNRSMVEDALRLRELVES